MAIAAPGVGSNLDINTIVTKLMEVEQQPVTALNNKEASFKAKLSAYGILRGALSAFQGSVTSLSTSASRVTFAATPSDTAILSATANAESSAGSYDLNVTKLAQAQSLVAAGQTSSSTVIGSGTATTLTFRFGTITGGTATNGVYSGATFTADPAASAATVTIDSSNNTLQGIKDAVNAANIGVKASIVKDGSTSPYRLVFQSTSSGAAHSMKIDVAGDAAIDNLLGHDPAGTQHLVETAAAQDAELMMNGVPIKSATNTVSEAIQGVTIKLLKTGDTSLAVARDTSAIRKGIDAFVKAYNELDGGIRALTKYDAQTKQGGALVGDGAARTIQSEIRRLLGSAAGTGASDGINTLSDIGIQFQRDGSLLVDTSKLDKALTEKYDGVAGLFGSMGAATDTAVHVATVGSKTKPGTYPVSVSTAASQAKMVGSAAAQLVISTGTNDQLNLAVDGKSANITIPAGTYTASSLSSLVQSLINGSSSFQADGTSVAITEASGVLTMVSNRYGSVSSISASGSAAASLFGSAPTNAAGVDVAGTINGLVGTGSGQKLTGAISSDVDGLVLDIGGTTTGSRGTVTVGNGYGKALNQLINSFLESDGVLTNRTDGINRSIQDIGKRRDALNLRLDDVEKRYRAQFTSLDTLISSMNSTSTFLTQQLAKLNSSS